MQCQYANITYFWGYSMNSITYIYIYMIVCLRSKMFCHRFFEDPRYFWVDQRPEEAGWIPNAGLVRFPVHVGGSSGWQSINPTLSQRIMMVGKGNHPQVSFFQVGELECHSTSSISIKSLDPCAGHLHLFYSALFFSQAPWAPMGRTRSSFAWSLATLRQGPQGACWAKGSSGVWSAIRRSMYWQVLICACMC